MDVKCECGVVLKCIKRLQDGRFVISVEKHHCIQRDTHEIAVPDSRETSAEHARPLEEQLKIAREQIRELKSHPMMVVQPKLAKVIHHPASARPLALPWDDYIYE